MSNILVLRGLRTTDIKKRTSNLIQMPAAPPHVSQYSKLPKVFSGVATWPKKSNLMCWFCGRIPTDYPRFLPLSPHTDENGADICTSHGNFDTWPCVASYVKQKYPPSVWWDLIQSICMFESLFTGVWRITMPDAPDPHRMEQYCGEGITSAEYTALNDRLLTGDAK